MYNHKLAGSKARLAIIGCGAVTEYCHLPGAAQTPEVEIAFLVDRNLERAQQLARQYPVGACLADYHQIDAEDIDGVIVALPHHLHAPVSIDFLKKRIPVLVEKPMALNLGECETMVQTANQYQTPLQVGYMNHFCQGAQIIHQAIQEGWLGPIQGFHVEWGFIYDWPIASGFFFDRTQAGGGVLLDLGSHVFDLLAWWFGEPLEVTYCDDDAGGVEANCEISLAFGDPGHLFRGDILLSRLRKLDNTARVTGKYLTMECEIDNPVNVHFWPTEKTKDGPVFCLDTSACQTQTFDQAYAEQLGAFTRVIFNREDPVVSGEWGLKSSALIDRCYRERQPLPLPWDGAPTDSQEEAW